MCSYCIPVSVKVIGHDIDKVQVSVGLESFVAHMYLLVEVHEGPFWSNKIVILGTVSFEISISISVLVKTFWLTYFAENIQT